MAITQEKVKAKELNFKDLCKYNLQTHRLMPTNELLNKYGYDLAVESQKNNFNDAELRNISDGVYEFILYMSHNENHDKIYALIAENKNEEQELIARAFGYYAHFSARAGDEIVLGSPIEKGVYYTPDQVLKSSMGMRLKQMLENGYGGNNTGIIKRSYIRKSVEDITDLEFGVDY